MDTLTAKAQAREALASKKLRYQDLASLIRRDPVFLAAA
jgi:hypothetical protein